MTLVRLTAASALVLAAAATAQAHDHASPTQFYIGAHAGWTWSEAETIDRTGYNLLNEVTDSDDDSFSGGFQGGVDHSFGTWFIGGAADVTFSGVDGEGISATSADTFYRTDIDWYGTVRARVGTTWDRFKLYATGGFALVNVDAGVTDALLVPGAGLLQAGDDDTRLGWTIGAGAEMSLGERFGLGAEYLYIDAGDIEFTGVDNSATTQSFEQEVDLHVARVTLNWYF